MLKPFDRYVLKEIASPFGIGLLVYTSTLLIDQILRLASPLIARSVSLSTFFLLLFYSLPDLLSFTIPMASLMGVLAGMSRMSSDAETLALRTMGIDNWRILRPVMLFSFLAFLSSFLFTSFLAPEANYRRSQMLFKVAISYNVGKIKPGIFFREIPQYTIFFADFAPDGNWQNVLLFNEKDPNEDILILAREGRFLKDESENGGHIELFNVVSHSFKKKEESTSVASSDQKIETIAAAGPVNPKRRSTQLTLPGLVRQIRREPHDQLLRLELHNKFALPFAAMALGFLGLSLGISTKKGGKTSGLIISLGIIFVYYVLITAGRNMISKGILSPLIGMWAPNAFLLAVGFLLFLFLKEEREINWERVFSWFPFIRKSPKAASGTGRIRHRFWILDAYVLRRIVSLFLLILVSLMLVFYIINIIDLMDEIIENKIPFRANLTYNYYMTPYTLTLILPIAILTAILLTFSFMSKNNEVIAVQVSGINLYRLTLPALILGLVVSVAVFAIQEKVLPEANQKASDTLDFIHQRKSVDELEKSKLWVLGQRNRVYFYSHYEKERDRFYNFNMIDFTGSHALRSWVTAKYAEWLGPRRLLLTEVSSREWSEDTPQARQKTALLKISIPEERSQFFEHIKFSEQMSIPELKRYISYLRRNQSATKRYEAQLLYNYAYPLSSLVLVFVAIPFSFLMGNRGALYGIGLAVGISLAYWGALGIFSALGKTALLPPFVSAFSPLILFTTMAVVLMGRVKT